ncbi:MAG TPA: hypothetical protein VKZ53_20475 [Candidatus Angelobacter sp.]|nr:hypothetical protein [Candidatus Angelobacter sp.]
MLIKKAQVRAQAIVVPFLLAALFALPAATAPTSVSPATHAKSYPAHESHEDEALSIAVDPFDRPEKTSAFKVNYQGHDLLPIRLIISNDGDNTVMLDNLQVEYVTAHRTKLQPATSDDLYRRMAKGGSRPDKPPVQLPIPLPRKNKAGVSKDTQNEIDSLQFYTVPVTAHSTNSGFLFFDVSGISSPEEGAHIYISGMKVNGKELFYFDIPLEKYLASQATK